MTDSKFDVLSLAELQLIENAISARSAEVEEVKNNKDGVKDYSNPHDAQET